MHNSSVGKALSLGLVSGLRVFVPPALLSTLSPSTEESNKFVLQLAAFCEFLYDQSSLAKDRTQINSLAMRMLSGFYSATFTGQGGNFGLLGFAGMTGAFCSTYVSFYVRKYLHTRYHIPNTALGLLEDVFAVALSYHVITQTSSSSQISYQPR